MSSTVGKEKLNSVSSNNKTCFHLFCVQAIMECQNGRRCEMKFLRYAQSNKCKRPTTVPSAMPLLPSP